MLPFEKRDGKILASQPVSKLFEELSDGFYELEINRNRNDRSTRQNRLLWQWLTECEKKSHAGYTKEEWHDIFCQFFLPPVKKRNPLDRRKWILEIRRTSKLSPAEFNEFLEKVRTAALTPNV